MPGTSNRGFASMDAQKQREIASKGGKAAHQKGTAHQFTPEEARRAGSKGGRAARQKRSAQQTILEGGVQPPTTEINNTEPIRRAGPIGMVDPRNNLPGKSRDIRRDLGSRGSELESDEMDESDPHHLKVSNQ